jgi:DNA-directed RNA polymerase specialized sigma24 family protein
VAPPQRPPQAAPTSSPRLYTDHADELRARLARITRTDPHTIEDAYAHAWTQLLSHPDIDLAAARASTLRWLTTTAAREAWRLHKQRCATARADSASTAEQADTATPAVEDLAAYRARLELIGELPERPRRFLLRRALGYTYREIAALEHVSMRTTDTQLARARRLLRDLDRA